MKVFNIVIKILAALAVIAGIVYVVATYGDKIVAWAKGLWAKISSCKAAPEAEIAEEVAEEEVDPLIKEADSITEEDFEAC